MHWWARGPRHRWRSCWRVCTMPYLHIPACYYQRWGGFDLFRRPTRCKFDKDGAQLRTIGNHRGCCVRRDSGPLIAAAMRHGKDQTGLMLDKCTQWLRLLVSFAQLSTGLLSANDQNCTLVHFVHLLVSCPARSSRPHDPATLRACRNCTTADQAAREQTPLMCMQ